MRVLWFTNGPMPAVNQRNGQPTLGSGYWMSTLLEELVRTRGIQVDVVTAHPGLQDDQFEADGVKYFVIGQPRWQSIFNYRKGELERCAEIVRERDPDLVHIHGTERFFGLLAARNLISMPCVISLQGLVGPYLPAFFGALSFRDLWRSHRLIEIATRRGLLWRYWEWVGGARQEQEILTAAKSFMGRTEWDRAHTKSVNPMANYYD